MAVFISRAQQTYQPGIYRITRAILPGTDVAGLRVTATDDGTWLPGLAVHIQLNGPVSQAAGWGGGTAPDRVNGGIRTLRIAQFRMSSVFADGTRKPLLFPPGDYEMVFQTFQTITSTVTGEWF